MPDFGVTHLTLGKPDGGSRGCERRVRKACPEIVEDRGLREFDGIARTFGREPPAVEDDEGYEREAAIRHRLEKEAGSSEAPPTSAPSTEGRDRSSAAFSGFTDPP